eukprot:4349920-Amphidinium_carterae.1
MTDESTEALLINASAACSEPHAGQYWFATNNKPSKMQKGGKRRLLFKAWVAPLNNRSANPAGG